MIVKVVVRVDAMSVWDKEDNRLYWSDMPVDIAYARKLNKEQPLFDAQGNRIAVHGEVGYYMAHWMKGKVNITKRVRGYYW